jgi:hypothetical protein
MRNLRRSFEPKHPRLWNQWSVLFLTSVLLLRRFESTVFSARVYRRISDPLCDLISGISLVSDLTFGDCRGNDLVSISTFALATCEMECHMRKDCSHFVYYGGICKLKSACSQLTNIGNKYYKTFERHGKLKYPLDIHYICSLVVYSSGSDKHRNCN